MHPIHDLAAEHDVILDALSRLEQLADDLEGDEDVNGSAVRDFVAFFRDYADELHHKKEEDELFPALIAAGMPPQGGPVSVMRMEHDEGRAMVGELTALAAGSVQDGGNRQRFVATSRRFSSLLRNHIAKENEILFPMAERMLPPQVVERIASRFSELDALSRERRATLVASLDSMQRKGGAP